MAPWRYRCRVELAQALVIAHEGGWDEILLVVGPLLLLWLLLVLAGRRARRLATDEEDRDR